MTVGGPPVAVHGPTNGTFSSPAQWSSANSAWALGFMRTCQHNPERGRAKKGARAGGGGGAFVSSEGGGEVGKGALVTGQSKEDCLKTLLMTHHHLRREPGRKNFKKKSPP